MNTGKFVVLSFVGLVAAYKLGKYHSTAAFTTYSNNRGTTTSSNTKTNNNNRRNRNKKRRNPNDENKPTVLNSTNKNDNEKNQNNQPTRKSTPNETIESITLKPIGKISSVYRLCVGTPRQGLLAPNSRGRIDLYPDRISSDSVLDLDQYSHVWIVFIFHLNSLSSKQRSNKQFSAKIAPPALGGQRVGIFATRTPHRPNPVGFSLCKLDRVVIPEKKKHCKAKDQPYSVYVSGLDLVDGTPVLDIKPYVPHYDSVGYVGGEGTGVDDDGGVEQSHNLNDDENDTMDHDMVRLPQWVSEGLDKRRPVKFMPYAEEQLTEIMTNPITAKQIEFYGVQSGRDESDEDGLKHIKSCIEEVLSVDVRSSFQTKKARKGKFQAERAIRVSDILSSSTSMNGDGGGNKGNGENGNNNQPCPKSAMTKKICTQQLDHLLIKYSVEEAKEEGRNTSTSAAVDTSGSGADDTIIVQEIELIPKKK